MNIREYMFPNNYEQVFKTCTSIARDILIKYFQTYMIPDKIITDSGIEFKNI